MRRYKFSRKQKIENEKIEVQKIENEIQIKQKTRENEDKSLEDRKYTD